MRVEDNTNCIECGNAFELHSLDRRCPKNGGYQINGKLEFFATHFEPEISETDELRARIDTLTAERDNLARLLKEGAGLANEYAAENARLTAAHAMQGEELVTLPRHMVYGIEDKLKEQAAEIERLTEKVRYAYVQIEALERVK